MVAYVGLLLEDFTILTVYSWICKQTSRPLEVSDHEHILASKVGEMTEGSHTLVFAVLIVVWDLLPWFFVSIWFSIYELNVSVEWILQLVSCGLEEEDGWHIWRAANFSKVSCHLNRILLRDHSIFTCFEIFGWLFDVD